MDVFVSLLNSSKIQMIVILIMIDVILGVVSALIKKEFVLGKLAGFTKMILRYVFGFAVITAVGTALPSVAMMVQIAYILIILALAGSILDNLGKFGLPVPKFLRK